MRAPSFAAMNSNTRTLRNPVEVLTTIPELCGFMPVESLVVLPFSEKYGGAVMRIDLPACEHEFEMYAAAVAANLTRFHDITQVAIAIYTHRPLGLDETPYEKLIAALIAVCDVTAIEVATVLVHASDGWCEYGGSRSGTIESLQHDHDLLAQSPTARLQIQPAAVEARDELAQLLHMVDEVMPRLHPFELLETWDELELAAAVEELDEYVLRLAVVVSGMRSVALTGLLLHHIGYGAEAVNELLAVSLLYSRAQRGRPGDAVLEGWWTQGFQCGREEDAPHTDEASEWSAASDFLQAAIDRVAIEAVDLDRCERATRLLRQLAAHLENDRRADVLSVLAWTHWASGNLTAADYYAQQVLRSDQTHPLAIEIDDLCARAVLPGWIGSTGCAGGVRDADLHDLIANDPLS